MSIETIHGVIGIAPGHDKTMRRCEPTAALLTTEADDSAVLRGTTRLADGRFWTESYDTDAMRIERTYVDDEGVTNFEPAIRHGSIEVGHDYVSHGEAIVMRKVDGTWRGLVDVEVRNKLVELCRRFPHTGLVPIPLWS